MTKIEFLGNEPQISRPLYESDRLAQEFPIALFGPNQLVGQLLVTERNSSQDWTRYESTDPTMLCDESARAEFEWRGWNPHLDKDDRRWLIVINGSSNLRFGIDALKIGLNNLVHLGGRAVLPYIHFKDFKTSAPRTTTSLTKYNVDYADLILLNRWQVDDLKSIVSEIK